MVKFIVLTLFTESFTSFLNTSIIAKSIQSNKLEVKLVDIREFTEFNHKKTDFPPYGGGGGMVLSPEPIAKALDYAISLCDKYEILYMSPRGKLLNYNLCKNYADKSKDVTYILLCGHYEGIDERVLEEYNIKEISIGDYVLTGGEIPTMVFIDSVSRLVEGIISEESLDNESHTNMLLEYPQYTKPSVFRGRKVPDILLSGNHKEIENWRNKKSLEVTLKNRPDLIEKEGN